MNEYLLKDRIIEEFLKTIEPNYNAAIAEVFTGKPSRDTVYAIAGFAAYVTSCSPAAMRLHAGPLRSTVEATGKILNSSGEIPRAPEALGGKSYTELIENGDIQNNDRRKVSASSWYQRHHASGRSADRQRNYASSIWQRSSD